MRVTFRPLTAWPHPETSPRRSRYFFKASWESTLELLQREVRMLEGDAVILGAFFREIDLRLDGMPRAGALVPPHPGIEISFDSRHGRLVYATDAYDHWQANLRAIALGLESLRAVDRYGVTRKGEQYAGWRALEAGAGSVHLPATLDEAKRVVCEAAGIAFVTTHAIWSDRSAVRSLIREATRAAHPDTGGDDEMFQRVQAARTILEGAA